MNSDTCDSCFSSPPETRRLTAGPACLASRSTPGLVHTARLLLVFAGSVTAGAAVSLVYVFGLIVIWLAPETKGKPLPA